jgi:N-acyl-D-amino-acid deacylase
MSKLTLCKTFILAFALAESVAEGQTGTPIPELAPVEAVINSILQRFPVPGAALAITHEGRLVLARGYGWADRDLKIPVQPDSLFRIGSISKPITSMAILQLVQEGKLQLDAPIVPLLGRTTLPPELIVDSRWNQITVRHLLWHAGGWDRRVTYDPMTDAASLDALGLSLPLREPVEFDRLVRYMATQPLQFTPGTKEEYSNFGYGLLGRILERVTGEPYEAYVQRKLMLPLGIQRARLGRSVRSLRALGEVEYYPSAGEADSFPVFPGIGDAVPTPDGGFYLEFAQAAGGWTASAMDLVRLATLLDVRTSRFSYFLRSEIAARPPYAPQSEYYGLGWQFVATPEGVVQFHDGLVPGTYGVLIRMENLNVNIAVVFNSFEEQTEFFAAAQLELIAAVQKVRQWPTEDQFSSFYPASPRIAQAGVVNGASQLAMPIVAGQLVTVFGENLGPAVATKAGPGALPVRLDGVEVLINGNPAPLVSVSRNRIDLIVPQSLPAGRHVLTVLAGGRYSRPSPVEVAASSPGWFSASGNGRGAVLGSNADGSANSEEAPAAPGSVVTLWATGLGPLTETAPDGDTPRVPSSIRVPVNVKLNGQEARVVSATSAPGYPGMFQVKVQLPMSLTPGRVMVDLTQSERQARPGLWMWVR